MDESFATRAGHIKLLLMDCDGVLTDGRIWLTDESGEQKSFNVRDGLGLELWHRAGFSSGIISGRTSPVVQRRARELGIDIVRQAVVDKKRAFEEVVSEAGVVYGEVAFIGDDLNDVPLMRLSELAIAVADASYDTKAFAHYVTRAKGGQGAIREAVEVILKAQGRWAELISNYSQK